MGSAIQQQSLASLCERLNVECVGQVAENKDVMSIKVGLSSWTSGEVEEQLALHVLTCKL